MYRLPKFLSMMAVAWVCLPVHAHLSGITYTSVWIAKDRVRLTYTVPADDLAELERVPDQEAEIREASAYVPIVYLASANLWTLRTPRDTAVAATPLRGRLALVFGFGLVHGLGFSAALSQIGLSYENRLLSLFYFNVGVEIGQLAVVLALTPLMILAWRRLSYRGVSATLPLIIGVSGGFWAVERAGFPGV